MQRKFYKYLPYLIIILFVINPLVLWPWSKLVFEVPKVWFILRYIEILILINLIFFPILIKEKIDLKLYLTILLFLLLIILSSIYGKNFNKSFWGNYYRNDGIFTLIHLLIFTFFVTLNIRKVSLKNLFTGILIGSSGVSFVTIFNGLIYLLNKAAISNWNGAIGSSFGNPNFLAGYLVVTLPIYWYFLDHNIYRKRLYFVFLFIQIIAIILTRSISGLIGIILYVTIIFLNKKYYRQLIIFFISIIIIVAGYFNLLNHREFKNQPSFIAESRTRIFIKGIKAFRQRPIFGYGWSNFDYAFDSINWPIRFEKDTYIDKAHSVLLEILVTTGVMGFTLYILIIFKTLYNLLKSKMKSKKFLLLILFLYVFHSQTNVISISEELIFWLIVGLSASHKMLAAPGK